MAANASLYVRLSKAALDSNTSREGMTSDLERLAADLGYEVLAVHVDDGISGAVRDRPEFLAWLEDARSGRASALLAWHGDRLTREGVNAAAMVLDVIEGKDPFTGRVIREPVHFADCHGLDSRRDAESFRWRFVIAAEVARSERERIKARNAAAQRRLREAHRYRGGSAPFGYRVVEHPEGKGKGLEVEPGEAAAIRRAAEIVLDGGSAYQAMKFLNGPEGMKPRRAEAWSLTTVRKILTGDNLLGRITHKRKPVRGEDGLPIAPWTPILTVDESERLRALLEPSGQGAGTHVRRRAARLLSGLLVCANCGSALRASPNGGRDRYLCPGYLNGSGCSSTVAVGCERTEEYVSEQYLRAFGALPYVFPETHVREDVEVAQVEQALREVTEAMREPGADVPALAEQITRLHARREELASAPVEPEVTWVDSGQTYGEFWSQGTVDDRRSLIRDALHPATGRTIAVHSLRPGTSRRFDPERFEIVWDHERGLLL